MLWEEYVTGKQKKTGQEKLEKAGHGKRKKVGQRKHDRKKATPRDLLCDLTSVKMPKTTKFDKKYNSRSYRNSRDSRNLELWEL